MDRRRQAAGGGADRAPGPDILRLEAMLMVIILHILGQGGILDAAQPGSGVWYAAWGLECLCYCAVDCCGLLSGYLSGGHRQRFSRLALLWLETVVWSLLYFAIFRLLSPEAVGRQALVNALFPVMRRQYWYFTGFFGLSVLRPVLDAGLDRVGSRRATALFFLLLAVYCVLPGLMYSDAFRLHGGSTVMWLLILQLLGALLGKRGSLRSLGPFPLLTTAALCLALTFATVLRPISLPDFGTFTLLNYISPTVLLFAACLLLLSVRARPRAGSRLLSGLSGASFGVYILHTNPLLWQLAYRPGCLRSWAGLPAAALVVRVLVSAAGSYLLFALLSSLLALLFRRLGLPARLEGLEARMRRGIGGE